MRKLQFVDKYKSFLQSMDHGFKNDKEAQIAASKLRLFKYSSDILKNFDILQQLNMKV